MSKAKMTQKQAADISSEHLKEFTDAVAESNRILSEFKAYGGAYVDKMLAEDVDAETAAYLICVKALNSLGDRCRAAVIKQLTEKFYDATRARLGFAEKELEAASEQLALIKDAIKKSEDILLRKSEVLREDLGEDLEIEKED